MSKMLEVCQLKDNSRAVKDGNETVLIGEYHQVLTSLLLKNITIFDTILLVYSKKNEGFFTNLVFSFYFFLLSVMDLSRTIN
jgi:hypothetical protein